MYIERKRRKIQENMHNMSDKKSMSLPLPFPSLSSVAQWRSCVVMVSQVFAKWGESQPYIAVFLCLYLFIRVLSGEFVQFGEQRLIFQIEIFNFRIRLYILYTKYAHRPRTMKAPSFGWILKRTGFSCRLASWGRPTAAFLWSRHHVTMSLLQSRVKKS